MKEQKNIFVYNQEGPPIPLEGEMGYYIFNPSNDMALAANSLAYIPPRNIMQMESDLALLPLWWAESRPSPQPSPSKGRVTNALSHADESERDQISNRAEHKEAERVIPWGWSISLRHRLQSLGFPEASLPSKGWIEEYRQMSSRAFAAEYIQGLLKDADEEGWGQQLVGRGMRVINSFRHEEYVDDKGFPLNGNALIFKTLWSSSGRGVFTCLPHAPLDVNRVLGAIRHQGAILMDDYYEEKLLDFAVEYVPDGYICPDYLPRKEKRKTPLFLSVFKAAENGDYSGNIVASQEELRQMILATGVSEDLLDKVLDYTYEALVRRIQDRYDGPLGVDMLICRHGGEIRIHPCIEINLRMNMGILASIVYNRVGGDEDRVLAGNPEHGYVVEVKDGIMRTEYRGERQKAKD